MYAVIKTGGKQYRVSQGDKLSVEKLNIEEGESVTFDDVLLVVDGRKIEIGNPKAGVKVLAKVLKQYRGDKIRVGRFRRRKRHHKIMGHRQYLTKVEITNIKYV